MEYKISCFKRFMSSMLRTLFLLLLIDESTARLVWDGDYLCGEDICIPDPYGDYRHDKFENVTDTVFVNVVLSIESETKSSHGALEKIDVKRMELSFVPTIILAWQDKSLKFPDSTLNNSIQGLEYVKLDSYLRSFIMKPENPKIMQATGASLLKPRSSDIGKRGNVMLNNVRYCILKSTYKLFRTPVEIQYFQTSMQSNQPI